jgi:hypothetical protein
MTTFWIIYCLTTTAVMGTTRTIDSRPEFYGGPTASKQECLADLRVVTETGWQAPSGVDPITFAPNPPRRIYPSNCSCRLRTYASSQDRQP